MSDLKIIVVDSPEYNEVIREVTVAAVKIAREEMSKEKESEFVTAEEAMKILDVSKSTLQNLRDTEQVQYTKNKRPAMYVRESLYKYLRSLV